MPNADDDDEDFDDENGIIIDDDRITSCAKVEWPDFQEMNEASFYQTHFKGRKSSRFLRIRAKSEQTRTGAEAERDIGLVDL